MTPERLVRITRHVSVKASEVAAVYLDNVGVQVMFISGKTLGVGTEVTVEALTDLIDLARREAAGQ